MNRIKIFFKDKINQKNILIFIAFPILINLVIEILSRSSIIQGIAYMFRRPIPFICNAMIIMITLSIALLVRRRVFVITVISVIWLIMGITNMIMLHSRVTPFNASDLRLLDTATSIIDKYFNVFTIMAVVVLLILVVISIIVLFIKGPKIAYKINYWKNIVVMGIMVALTFIAINISIETGYLSIHFSNLTNAYNEYGFVYCFGNGLLNTGVKKPSDYSQETIDQIMNEIRNQSSNNDSKEVTEKPNIIFLQLESFFDINKVKDIIFSSDPIPYFNSLKSQYSSGYLSVFNVGYGTCNTEFEVMTGMNLDDFGPGEIPYKTILQKNTCESTAYDLKKYGYATHAIHNNRGTFYSRNTVFENLGFDSFTSLEYMNVEEFTPMNWAKDKCLIDEIFKALKSTEEQDYIYTISVQGHGSYPTSEKYENPSITVDGVGNVGRKNAIEYYVNEINEMDSFIKDLTNALSSFDEKTILVMYGDHLPGLGFSKSDLQNEDINQTEYVIWNNMDLPVVHEDIQAFQLSSKVLGLLNMDEGVVNKYHQTHKESEEYLNGLQNLEYDILYGDKLVYGGINPYSPTDIMMGVLPIEITKVEERQIDNDKLIYIEGTNFTEYSKVYVNGDSYDTEFIDSNTLSIKYDNITTLDSFVVSQVDTSGNVLSSTKECLYYK